MSSGLRPKRRPARLQRRRRSAALGSGGQAWESTTRTQDAAINDPTCAAFVESYAPGRGIGFFIYGVFCQAVFKQMGLRWESWTKTIYGPVGTGRPILPGPTRAGAARGARGRIKSRPASRVTGWRAPPDPEAGAA